MKVYILDREYEFDNNKEYIDDIVKTIYRDSNRKGYSFAYVVVDGKDIYSNFRDYIESNIKSIKTIKVVSMTFREMTLNSIVSIRDYISEERITLPILGKMFREGSDEENLKSLEMLLEGISWIIEYFHRIDGVHNLNHIISDYYIWNEFARDIFVLGDILTSLDNYIMEKQEGKIGETIDFEITPIFDSMLLKLDALSGEKLEMLK